MNTYFSFLQVVSWCNNVRDASWLSPILFWWSSNNLQKGLVVIFICLISSLSVEPRHLVSFNVMQIYFDIMRDTLHYHIIFILVSMCVMLSYNMHLHFAYTCTVFFFRISRYIERANQKIAKNKIHERKTKKKRKASHKDKKQIQKERKRESTNT